MDTSVKEKIVPHYKEEAPEKRDEIHSMEKKQSIVEQIKKHLIRLKDKKKPDLDESYYMASQWQLMGRRFKKHKLAKYSLIILGLFYFGAVFAGFLAPQGLVSYDSKFTNCPPTKIHFIDSRGKFHLTPFVYAIKSERNAETYRKEFIEDKSETYPIRLFTHGAEYKFWGLFKTDIHLFNVNDPGRIFLFGTDSMGRDLFSRILHGSRISLSVGFVGVFISLILGIIIGGISGYFGGILDNVIQRIIEILRSFPTIPLWMALSAAIPPQIPVVQMYFYITIILSFLGWTTLARVVRSKFMSMREEDYIMAARVAGVSTPRIIATHMVPGFLSYIIINMTLAIPQMIIAETSLSFLGLGIRSPATSWGVLLQEAQQIQNVALYPWLLIPLLFVVVTVLSFNFLGDGLRDAADPYK